MISLPGSNWLPRYRPGQERVRLFCLPYAGGGASIFHEWGRLPAQVCPVQLPGHEERRSDRPFADLTSLVAALTQVLTPLFSTPYALFGHSMGALVAFELTRAVRACGFPPPLKLFISAHRAPHLPYSHTKIHTLSDLEFIEELRGRYRGLSEETLRSYELMMVFLPALRADYAMVENYTYRDGPPLACPIMALGGTKDTWAPEGHLAQWRAHTTSSFQLQMFDGDHFFLHECRESLLEAIAAAL